MNKFIKFKGLNFFLILVVFSFYHNIAQGKVISKQALPNEIFIKTRTETFDSRSFFLIRDGKIWTKKNTKEKANWHLMPNNGIPFSLKEKNFPKPEKIVEIYADGDELIAVDNKGRFFTYTELKNVDYSNLWHYNVGFPKDPIIYDQFSRNNRSLARGRRHFDVMWYEDRFGNQHHYGTMGTSTTYLLSNDGKEIMYTDNGLPADFSHRICGPNRGKFVGINLQASGGTIFVINDEGKMYTKMDDFDINGGTAMFFKYTYKRYRSRLPGTDFRTAISPVALPVEDWKEQPKINLKNKAKITKKITILQTGYGNESRELRVAGLDENANKGFYFKKIFDTKWKFKKTNLILNKADFINNSKSTNAKILNLDLKYTGYVTLTDGSRYLAEFTDFNLQCSPANLVIHLGNNKKAELKFHTVEAWTYMKRLDPGRDGTPKIFLGTLEIKKDQLNLVPDELKKLNLETFAFSVSATLNNIYINSVENPNKIDMDFGIVGNIPKHVKSKIVAKIVSNTQYISINDLKRMARELKIPFELLNDDLKISDLPKLKKEFKRLQNIENIFREFSNDQRNTIIKQKGIVFFYGFVEKTVYTLNAENLFIFSDKGTQLIDAYYNTTKSDFDNIKKDLEEKRTQIKSFLRSAVKKIDDLEKQTKHK